MPNTPYDWATIKREFEDYVRTNKRATIKGFCEECGLDYRAARQHLKKDQTMTKISKEKQKALDKKEKVYHETLMKDAEEQGRKMAQIIDLGLDMILESMQSGDVHMDISRDLVNVSTVIERVDSIMRRNVEEDIKDVTFDYEVVE